MNKICANPTCGKSFEAKTDRAIYCSGSCRAKASVSKRKRGLSGVAETAKPIDSPLMIQPNSSYNEYGNTVPRFIFQEKVNHINELTNALREATNQLNTTREELRNLRTEKFIYDKIKSLESSTKPSPLSGIVETLFTPEGLQTVFQGIVALKQPTLPANNATPGVGISCNDETKNTYLKTIAEALNNTDLQTAAKASTVMLALMDKQSAEVLNQLYEQTLKSQTKAA